MHWEGVGGGFDLPAIVMSWTTQRNETIDLDKKTIIFEGWLWFSIISRAGWVPCKINAWTCHVTVLTPRMIGIMLEFWKPIKHNGMLQIQKWPDYFYPIWRRRWQLWMEFSDTAAPQDTEEKKKAHSSVTKTAINMCTFFLLSSISFEHWCQVQIWYRRCENRKKTRGIGKMFPHFAQKAIALWLFAMKRRDNLTYTLSVIFFQESLP